MIKKEIKRLGHLFGISLVLLLCITSLLSMKAKADDWIVLPSNTDYFYYMYPNVGNDFRNYGESYEAVLAGDSCHSHQCSYYGEDGRIHYLFKVEVQNSDVDELFLFDCDEYAQGYDVIVKKNSFKRQYDKSTKTYTYTYSVTTEKYLCLYVINYSNKKIKYKSTITAEPEMILSQTSISEITNTRSHTMTVKYEPVRKRLGYQIEYATDNKFKDKARVNTGATSKDVGKLTIGKTYYVRVRVYARYNDGTLVYSKWSGTRKIKIKK